VRRLSVEEDDEEGADNELDDKETDSGTRVLGLTYNPVRTYVDAWLREVTRAKTKRENY